MIKDICIERITIPFLNRYPMLSRFISNTCIECPKIGPNFSMVIFFANVSLGKNI